MSLRPLPVPPTNKESLPTHHYLLDHLFMLVLRGLATPFLPTTALPRRKIPISLPIANHCPAVTNPSATTTVIENGTEIETETETTGATTAIAIILSHTATGTAIETETEIGTAIVIVIATDTAVTGTGTMPTMRAARHLRTTTVEKMV